MNGWNREILPFLALIVDSLPANQVNHTTKTIFNPDWDLDGGSGNFQLGSNLVDNPPGICAGSS